MNANEDTQVAHGDGSFVTGSVRVVDYDAANNNVLIRGSSAFGTRGFTITDLTKAIAADVNFAATKIKLAANPMVIDFCLIGFAPATPEPKGKKPKEHKDEKIVMAEVSWFTDQPPTLNGNAGPYPNYIPSTIAANPGMMVYWPIQSIGGVAPTSAGASWPVSPANSIGDGSTQFDFSGLVPAIRNALTNQIQASQHWPAALNSIKNAIIYVHCDSGVNRTGAAVAGYLMNYGSNLAAMSLPPVNKSAYTVVQAQTAANLAPPSNDTKPPGGSDIPVVQAYCNFLITGNLDADLQAKCVPIIPKTKSV
ncbi:MAG: hypothetical protein K2P84_11990 [Undibacterium sp.]|nr:hypothetical protein [Undibacterium sp.]